MKTVLITGAGIGIGRATAKMFGTHGWRVIVTDVLEDEGAVVAAEINASGGTAEFHTLDVTSTAAAEAVLASVHASHGPLIPSLQGRSSHVLKSAKIRSS